MAQTRAACILYTGGYVQTYRTGASLCFKPEVRVPFFVLFFVIDHNPPRSDRETPTHRYFYFSNYLFLSYGYFIHSYGRRQLRSLKARTLAHVHRLLLVTLMSPVSPKYDGNLPSNPEAEEQAQTMPYPFQFIFVLSWHLTMD